MFHIKISLCLRTKFKYWILVLDCALAAKPKILCLHGGGQTAYGKVHIDHLVVILIVNVNIVSKNLQDFIEITMWIFHSFQRMEGMKDLMNWLPEFEFVFGSSPYKGIDFETQRKPIWDKKVVIQNLQVNAYANCFKVIKGNVWIRDPPGGKDHPTTDPHWADESIEYLDMMQKTEGPFYAVLGYSQGC